MRQSFSTVASILFLAGTLAGCATARGPYASGSASAPDEIAAPAPAAPPVVATPRAPDELPAAGGTAPPVAATPCAPAPCAPPPCAPPPCAEICGLPCESGCANWHLRGVAGWVTFLGEDAGTPCSYWGGDFGRTLCGTKCGCWGMDAFYRTHSTQFDRDPAGEDGGYFHHVGVKLTYERSLGGRFYVWAGAGPEYFWTTDYLDNDSGFGAYGEAGLGFLITRSLRARVGVNAHAINTDVGRQSPADDGESRWLWIIAPVVQLEFDF